MSHFPGFTSRREFLRQSGAGLGAVALATLLRKDGLANPQTAASTGTDFPPRVKRVIFLFMHGGPSHVDLFDPKPDLIKYAGQPLPESYGMVMTRRKVATQSAAAAGQAVSPARPVGDRDQRLSARHRGIARRPVRDSLLPRRQRQPSAVGLPDEHRLDPDGQAEPGELGQLRAGEREPGHAGVPGACPTRAAA